MAEILMRARVQIKRGGRVVPVGHTFRTSPIEAAALRYQKRAEFVDARRAELPAAESEQVGSKLNSPSPAGPDDEAPSTSGRRRYRRRDMVAESN